MNSAPFINNFSGGQVTRKFDARFDASGLWRSCARQLLNVVVNQIGNAIRFPGTKYIGEAANSAGLNITHKFIFSDNDALHLEFSALKMRVIYQNEVVQSGGSDYVLTTPYTESDLRNIKLAQDKDIVYIVDGSHFPRKLIRTANNNWSISLAPLTWGPLLPSNLDITHTMTCSVTAIDATGTLTSSLNIFTSDHYSTTEGGAIFAMAGGYVQLTGAPSTAKIAPIVVRQTLTSGAETDDWAEGMFSVERGFPQAVALFESRLFFAGTEYKQKTVVGSVSEVYEKFKEGAEDIDAVSYDVISNQLNIIRWLDSGKVLGIGTNAQIKNLSTGTGTEGITPSNFLFSTETNYGCNRIQPVSLEDAVYYIADNGIQLREFIYNFQSDSFKSTDKNKLFDYDDLGSPIVQIAVQYSPFPIVWAVTEAGKLFSFTRILDEKIEAWCEQDVNGIVESVSVIPNGVEDQILLTVKRTINESVVRHLEYVMPFNFGDDVEDAFFVNAGVTYEGATSTTIGGLSHLEGESVSILTNGATHPEKIVVSGSVSLDISSTKVHVGLGNTYRVHTLPLEAGSMNGTSQGKQKRIRKAAVRLYRSVGFSIYTSANDNAASIPFRDPTMSQGQPIPLFTGDKVVKMPDGIDTDAEIIIENSFPLPCNVLGIFPLSKTADV